MYETTQNLADHWREKLAEIRTDHSLLEEVWRRARQEIRNAALEEAAGAVAALARHYPTSVFTEPPVGQHGKTVDACSARAIRAVLPAVAAEIRALKHTEQHGR